MKIAGLLGAITVLILGVFFLRMPSDRDATSDEPVGSKRATSSPSLFIPPTTAEKEPIPDKLFLTPEEVNKKESLLIAALNRPETEVKDDVHLLKTVFSHYRSVFKNNPIGIHQEIIHQLTGGNVQGIVYIPKTHPALVNGQLHDRWGSPFYFHQISRHIMEVRSAGPDKIHWNDDDISTR